MGMTAIEGYFDDMEKQQKENEVVVLPASVELNLKRNGEDYATCAGNYTEYTEEYGGLKVYSNKELHRVILFYGGKW